jgi:hypothetical protein
MGNLVELCFLQFLSEKEENRRERERERERERDRKLGVVGWERKTEWDPLKIN